MIPFFRQTFFVLIAVVVLHATSDSYAVAQTSTEPSPIVKIRKGLPVPVNPDINQARVKAQACAPATALRDLEWNNVRALIENGGTLCLTGY
jgi:hypothetical protein